MTQSDAGEVAVLVDHEGNNVELRGQMDVGRSSECAIVISDAKVSRRHATITVSESAITIEDHGSSNGTWVNGLRIGKLTTVLHGDDIYFEKHCFKLQLPHADEDLDATVVDIDEADDETIVSIPRAEELALEPVSRQPAVEVASTPEPRPALSGGDFDLPGSWVDAGTGDETRVLSMAEASSQSDESGKPERVSDLAHLMVSTGQFTATFELALGDTSEPDVWEIGRDEGVEIQLLDPSVSNRHAQLIHQGGRWRLVNLVSTNGIYVNDEKRLTAYLSDGDSIRLGTVTLVFHAALGAATVLPLSSAVDDAPSSGNGMAWAAAAIVAAAFAGLAWWLL